MRKSIRFMPALALGIAGAILHGNSAVATPITYVEDATATGSLGGVAFTDATVTLTMMNNTTNVTNPSTGLFLNIGTATVSVDGAAPVAFTELDSSIFQSICICRWVRRCKFHNSS